MMSSFSMNETRKKILPSVFIIDDKLIKEKNLRKDLLYSKRESSNIQ